MCKRAIIAIAVELILSGCGTLGPTSITASRNYYNEVIHDTSAEQLLLNIVRASKFETVSFVDVSEADATVSFTGGVAGGSSNIGARAGTTGGTLAGSVGSVTGTFQYGDSALVRYTPVLGYPLIQQVSSPIAPDSMVRLFNSDFALASIVEFAVDRAAPGYADSALAKDRITILDLYGSIVLSSEGNGGGAQDPSKSTSMPRPGLQGTAAADQNLVIHLQDKTPRDPNPDPTKNCPPLGGKDFKRKVANLWKGLTSLYSGSAARDPRALHLQGSGGNGQFFTTRSAIGVLKLAEDPAEEHDFAFVTPDKAASVRDENKNAPCFRPDAFFYFNPVDGDRVTVEESWERYFTDALNQGLGESDRREVRSRDSRRAFVLIERSANAPVDAYVAIYRKGLWYSISDNDSISKANFALLNQIITIQSVPQQNQQLQASIPVGR